MSEVCFICCDSYNQSNRKCIKCQYCELKTCRSCMERYLTQEDTHQPVCMNPSCKRPWIDEFLSENMYKKFMQTDYKNHVEKKLYDVEMSFMPATQMEIEKDIEVDKIQQSIWAKNDEIKKLKEEIIEEQLKIFRLRNSEDVTGHHAERRLFIRNCPSETCKGFLSTQWKCGLCNVHACKDCHEIKVDGEEHACDPAVVETVQMLAKDSKNCPKCSASIYKIDGCDQMFCTQCHTSFSWNSLKIVTNGIHNPHYFEWLRNNSANGEIERTAGDGYCPQNLRNPWVIRDKLRGVEIKQKTLDVFWAIFQIIQHISDIELRRFPTLQQNDLSLNMDIRKKFMKGEMTKEQFQSQVQQRDKKRRKCNDFCQIWTMFVNICTEHINQLCATTAVRSSHVIDLIHTIESLTEYSNTTSEAIGKRYSSVFPMVNIEWKFVTVKKVK